jgi:hypothetical protein
LVEGKEKKKAKNLCHLLNSKQCRAQSDGRLNAANKEKRTHELHLATEPTSIFEMLQEDVTNSQLLCGSAVAQHAM